MKNKIILSLAIGLLLFSCNHDCERGEGQRIAKTFSLSEFDGIDISSWGDVEIVQSNEHKLIIHSQANVMGRFKVNVKKGTLFVGADCFNSRLKPKLTVYCKNLSLVRLTGAGDITSSSTFHSDHLDVELTGSGDIQLQGEAEVLKIKVSGSGDIKLFNVVAQQCDVKISGVSTCEVHAVKSLNVKISGSGKVYYKGYPAIDQEITGAGKVISKN